METIPCSFIDMGAAVFNRRSAISGVFVRSPVRAFVTALALYRAGAVFLALCLALGLSTAVNAQTISQLNDVGAYGGPGVGQVFTATVTGNVTQIQVRPNVGSPAGNVYFFNGTGSGTNNSFAGSVSSQAVTLTATVGPAMQTIVLNTPLPVVAGNQYAFAFDGSSNLRRGNNDYGSGYIIVFFNQAETQDLVFSVTEVAAPSPVPTLGEWAMILFGLALAGGATLYIQRRQLTA